MHGKTPVRIAQLQLAEQSTKICETNHEEILEEMWQRQHLDYDEEEETDDEEEQEDDVSSGEENSKSEFETSNNDT